LRGPPGIPAGDIDVAAHRCEGSNRVMTRRNHGGSFDFDC